MKKSRYVDSYPKLERIDRLELQVKKQKILLNRIIAKLEARE